MIIRTRCGQIQVGSILEVGQPHHKVCFRRVKQFQGYALSGIRNSRKGIFSTLASHRVDSSHSNKFSQCQAWKSELVARLGITSRGPGQATRSNHRPPSSRRPGIKSRQQLGTRATSRVTKETWEIVTGILTFVTLQDPQEKRRFWNGWV